MVEEPDIEEEADNEQTSGDELDAAAYGDNSVRKTRVAPATWIKITDEYQLGTKGIKELAEEYGISRQSITRYFQSNKIIRGSRAHELQERLAKQQEAAQKAAERFAEKRAEWVEETRMQSMNLMKQVAALLSKRMIDIYKTPGATPAEAMDDIRALKLYQQTLIENFSFRLNDVLKADQLTDENDLPTLSIEDLTDRDLLDHYREIGVVDDEKDDIDEIVQSMENVVKVL